MVTTIRLMVTTLLAFRRRSPIWALLLKVDLGYVTLTLSHPVRPG